MVDYEQHTEPRLKLGISTCLLGENVRYDGGHKRDPFLTETLGKFVDYVPVCPEVECGLGVPREAMRLLGDPSNPRLVTVKTNRDLTSQMVRWAETRLEALSSENLCGFVFKKNSPSSGMARVKVYDGDRRPAKSGSGIFAKMFMARFPLIPAEEEGRLHDIALRENFIERIFVMRRWREVAGKNKSTGGLVDFHTREKLLFMAHSPNHARQMGARVGRAAETPVDNLFAAYETLMAETLRRPATPRKHADVLYHMMGYFKKILTADEKQELLEIIERFRTQGIPLVVPLTLFNHYIRKYGQPYLSVQRYLNPHPAELSLRNHV